MGEHWEEQQKKFEKYCNEKHLSWDVDVFADTVLKIAEKIASDGLKDDSPDGYNNYMFQSFKRNIVREKQYARNARRDDGNFDVAQLWEDYANANMLTAEEKLKRDLKMDFSVLYLANVLLNEFGGELTHIFLSKFYYNQTYQQLTKKYHIPRLRDKLLEMKQYLQNNVTKAEIEEAFQLKYKDLYD